MDFEARLRVAQAELRPFFLWLTHDSNVADEVIQFASVQCWRRWPNKETAELERLMTTIGRRFYMNYRAKQRNERNRIAELGQRLRREAPSDPWSDPSDFTALRVSLNALSEPFREVLSRVFFLGQRNHDIA